MGDRLRALATWPRSAIILMNGLQQHQYAMVRKDMPLPGCRFAGRILKRHYNRAAVIRCLAMPEDVTISPILALKEAEHGAVET